MSGRWIGSELARALALAAAWAGAAAGQGGPVSALDGFTRPTMAPGSPAGSYPLSGFDTINPSNRNLNFSLVLHEVTSRGGIRVPITLPFGVTWQVRSTQFPLSGTCGGNGCDFAFTFFPTENWWNNLSPIGLRYLPGIVHLRSSGDDRYEPVTSGGYRLGERNQVTNNSVTATLPDRTEIELRDAKTSGKPVYTTLQPNPSVGYDRGKVFSSVDGAAATFILPAGVADNVLLPGGTTNPSGTLLLRDGSRLDVAEALITKMTDRNGNQITASYANSRVTAITSGTETVTFTYNGASDTCIGMFDEITYPGASQATKKIRINFKKLDQILGQDGAGTAYQIKNPSQLFAAPGAVATPNVWGASTTTAFNKCFVSDVQLPNGRSYNFKYNSHGMLVRVELPAGGAFEYEYEPSLASATSPGDTPVVLVKMPVKEKRVYRSSTAGAALDSKTVFQEGLTAENYTDVKTYAGDGTTILSWTRHYFYNRNDSSTRSTLFPGWQDFKEYKTEELDASGNVLRRTEQVHEQRPVDGAFNGEVFDGGTLDVTANGRAHDPRLRKTTASWLNGTTAAVKNSVTEYDYDRYSNQTEIREYGFGALSEQGPLLRRTANSYWTDDFYAAVKPSVTSPDPAPSSSVHIRGLLKASVVKDGSGSQQAETKYFYDNMAESLTAVTASTDLAAVTDQTSVPFHDDTDFGLALKARGNQTKVKRWKSGTAYATTSRTYNTLGNVLTAADGRSNTVSYSYAASDGCANTSGSSNSHAYVTKITYPPVSGSTAAMTEKYCWDYTLGRPKGMEDANGAATSYTYESTTTGLDRLKQISYPDGGTAEYEYCDNFASGCTFNSWSRPAPAGPMVYSKTRLEAATYLESWKEFDGLGRELESRQRLSPQDIVASKTYDGLNRIRTASPPYYAGDTATNTQTTYDLLGRPTEVKNLGDNSLAKSTPLANEVTTEDASRAAGNLAGDKRKLVNDSLGRVEQVVEDQGVSSLSTYYRYNALDKLVGVCQGAAFSAGGVCTASPTVQARSFAYDGLARLTSATNPESGTTAYTYDDNSNLETKTDGDGAVSTTTYDALNRPLTRSYSSTPRTGPSTRFCYEGQLWSAAAGQCAVAAAAIGNAAMRLTDVWTADSRTRYTGFDAMGRILGSVQETGAATLPFAYTHTYAGSLKSITYPSGRQVSNSFDTAGRTTGLSGLLGAATTAYASQLTYAAHGAMKQMQFGNTLYETQDHSLKRLQPRRVSLGTTAGGIDRGSLEFSYCAGLTYSDECAANSGNILTQRILTGGATASFTQSYSYDGFNRLKSAVETGSGSTFAEGYGFDRFGNMWLETPGSPGTNKPCAASVPNCLHVNGANNRLDGATYDTAGNRLGMGPMGVTYDGEGRVTQVTATGTGDAQYQYDGLGKRVRATQMSGTTVLRTTVFGYDAAGNLAAEMGPAAEAGEAGTWYVTVDQLGSTRMMTRGAGEVARRFDYAPFGEELAGSGRSSGLGYGATGPRQRFTGKERDAETGLDYFGARYMSSAQGRFTSPDEWAGGIVDPFTGQQVGKPGPLPYADITDPQTINKYAYVRNNPLRYTDPDGHVIDTLADIGFIAYDIYDIAKNGASTTSVLALGADVVGAVVPFATGLGAGVRAAHAVEAGVHATEAGVHLVETGAHAAEAGVAKGDKVLYRRGANDSEKLLKTQAQAAESAGLPHGVSVSTSPAAKPGQVVRCATCSSVEAAGFKVHKTGSDPSHHTVELPKPITKKIAEKWNELFK